MSSSSPTPRTGSPTASTSGSSARPPARVGTSPSARRPGRKTVTVAEPAGWDTHQAAEALHLQAERKRLTYVASTRAGELLVVSRFVPDAKKGYDADAWARLLPFIGEAEELAVPDYEPPASPAAGVTAAQADDALRSPLRGAWRPSPRRRGPRRW